MAVTLRTSVIQGYLVDGWWRGEGVLGNDLSVMLEFPKYVNLGLEEGHGAANEGGMDHVQVWSAW